MKISVLAHLDRYEDQLNDRLKVAVFLLSALHRKFAGTDLFMFHFYDAKILMGTPICSVHPPKEAGPIKVGNFGERIGIGLKWAQYNLEETVEWNIKDESAIALYVYFQTLLKQDFDWEGNYQGWSTKRGRRFSYPEMNEMFSLR